MSWYRGRYVFSKRSLAQWMAESKKDYHFRVKNKDKADPTVVSTACRVLYNYYEEYCQQQAITPLSNRQFKQNMELLGFVYQKHRRFYVGYYGNKVTTAYKNIGIFKR